MYKYLFYISENYSFEILRPLQKEALAQGHDVHWFVMGSNVNLHLFLEDEQRLTTLEAVQQYSPDAVFVPGNVVPKFISGLKVQVFHGLEWKKKGHFKIRGWFDLYCTHGKATTSRFNQLAEKHQYFDVVETGWPKLDNLFTTPMLNYKLDCKKPKILFAPTFSPSLTSAYSLFEQIKYLVSKGDAEWLVKFHPKMAEDAIHMYKSLQSENFKVLEQQSVNDLLQWADLMISDTSSIIGEFALLGKAVVTYNNSNPGDYLIDINSPDKLETAIQQALNPDKGLAKAIKIYADELHPYKDGLSSKRILEATNFLITNPSQIRKKPFNLFRSLKLRNKLNYWKFN